MQCDKLPVELISFTGEALTDGNLLKWVTATEIDNDYFTLERSQNGIDFEEINIQSGAGNTNVNQYYEFLDKEAPIGVSYYKLYQTDFDGTSTYAGIVELYRGDTGMSIVELWPNPASTQVNILFNLPESQQTSILVYDAIGRTVHENMSNRLAGLNQHNIALEGLASGVYFVEIKSGSFLTSQKFIIE